MLAMPMTLMMSAALGVISTAGVVGLWYLRHFSRDVPPVPNIPFSDDARDIIERAAVEARTHVSAAITPEHVLLALLDGTGRTTNAARTDDARVADRLARTDRETLRAQLYASLPAGTPSVDGIMPPFTSRAANVLRESVREAAAAGAATTTRAHLLIGILREGRSTAARLLHAERLTLADARAIALP